MDPLNGLQITLTKLNTSSSSSNDNENNDSFPIQDAEMLPDRPTAATVDKQDQINDDVSANTASSLHCSDILAMLTLGH